MRIECTRIFCKHDALSDISKKISTLNDLFTLPSACFDQLSPSDIKKAIKLTLLKAGWACNVRVPGSKLSVNFVLDDIALCVQLGNVARTYADLLKLQTMYNLGRITIGIIAVPVQTASRILGSNHAQFERLVKEIELFRETISMPIAVIGLGD